jgi:hypothetical protein
MLLCIHPFYANAVTLKEAMDSAAKRHPMLEISKINIVGEDISDVNWQFQSGNTLASKGQKMIYWGNLRPLENMLLRSRLTPLAYLASNIYHNEYWLRFKGKKRITEAMKTQWGRLFLDY